MDEKTKITTFLQKSSVLQLDMTEPSYGGMQGIGWRVFTIVVLF